MREKGEKTAETEENIESKNKETMDEDRIKEEKENNVRDSEETTSKDSSNREEEAKLGKNGDDMENLNLTVKDYAGIDKNSSESERDITCLDEPQDTENSSENEQDITCLDENQDSKNSGSIKEIYLDKEAIKSVVEKLFGNYISGGDQQTTSTEIDKYSRKKLTGKLSKLLNEISKHGEK